MDTYLYYEKESWTMRTAIVSNLLKYYSLLCKNIFRLSPMIRSEIVSIPVLKDSFPTSQRLCFNFGGYGLHQTWKQLFYYSNSLYNATSKYRKAIFKLIILRMMCRPCFFSLKSSTLFFPKSSVRIAVRDSNDTVAILLLLIDKKWGFGKYK